MADKTKVEQVASRIAYVEPNDIHGEVNGVPLTPNYEDFCIGFNLVAEKVNRFNSNEYKGNRDKNDVERLTISWGQNTKKEDVSFMSGVSDNENVKHLTTYYTDIVYENYKGKNIIEGIGVENVNVSFESFYTPTITIKFVDVRGSSLFGREAAIHEQGEISSENIFGCFFTYPYPRFKLQIKGFYGKAVTYQLTCSNFKGNFNATNGNFEFIATFIGYNYALLTDIPILYLIAAPFCSYEGKKYWEAHKSSPQWLVDGKPMVKMHVYMQAIERHMVESNEKNGVSEEDSESLNNITNERSMLNDIIDAYDAFVKSMTGNSNGSYILEIQKDEDRSDTQLFLMYNDVDDNDGTFTLSITDDIRIKHEDLITKLRIYNEKYTSNAFDDKKYPNGKNVSYEKGDTLRLTKIFSITVDENTNSIENITVIADGCSDTSPESLRNITFNEGRKLNKKMSEAVSKMITTKPYNVNIKSYVHLIDLSDLSEIAHNRVKILNEQYNELQTKIDRQIKLAKADALPFKPTVGNIFKMLMAHLETFIHILWQCKSDIINSGDNRKPSNLNVDIKQTDVLSSSHIPPFPAVYTKGSSIEQSGDLESDNFVLGWIGDFSPNFIEKDVVVSIWKAMTRIMEEEKSNNENKYYTKIFPIFPSDINSHNNPFGNTTTLDISSLGGYLGIRASQIFGLLFNENYAGNLTDDIISTIGRMDAYNYYLAKGSSSSVNMDIFDRLGNQNPQTIFKNIALCDSSSDMYGTTYPNTNKTRHSFENNLCIKSKFNNKERCPILRQSESYNDRYTYTRYYDENEIGLVPVRLDEYSNYSSDFFYKNNGGDNIFFVPKYGNETDMIKAGNYVNRSTTNDLLAGETEENKKKYFNDNLFNIITDNSDVNDIIRKYDELKSGKVEMMDYSDSEDFTQLLDKCWMTSETRYCKFYNGYSSMFNTSWKKYGFDEKNILPKTKDDEKLISSVADNSWITKDLENGVKYTDEGKLSYLKLQSNKDGTTGEQNETLTIDDVFVHQFKIYHNWGGVPLNLFGHSFYYMQNGKKNGENDAEYNDRRSKSKALMFLHSMGYDLNYIPNFINKDKKNGGIEAVPYAYLLLLGGLLWRNRYIEEHKGNDPIIYSEGSIQFKEAGPKNTLFVKNGNAYDFHSIGKLFFMKNYNVSIASILGYADNEDWEFDYIIENRLIRLFENFVNGKFKDITLKCELYERITKNGNTTIKPFTAISFTNMISLLSRKIYAEKKGVSEIMGFYKNNVDNIYGNYSNVYVHKDEVSGISLMLSEENAVQEIIKNLYYSKSIVLDSLGYRLYKKKTAPREVYVKKTTFDTYLTAFSNQLRKMVDAKGGIMPSEEEDEDKISDNKNLRIAIYYYLKDLYDKWLIQMRNSEYYNVENFFKQNFVFIDKFYRNIYNKLIINCEVLLNILKSRITDTNASLFSVIGDIAKEHQCAFVSLAEYISFGNNNINDDIKELEKAFKPIPFNDMNEMRDENHFVMIYVGNGASTASDNNYYRSDGFNINTPDDIPSPFKVKTMNYNDTDIETRYGYNVPSFGVSFGRQNQSIFKNVTVNMNNPAMTEIAARTMEKIARLGSTNDHKVVFYGQDVFNIFKNYSYECEVEMLGNAQIMPLMYFQLLNIPMWHGAYMIKSVTHNMSPGNMTTRFKGQKMSKYIQPFCDDYILDKTTKDTIDPYNKSDVYSVGNITDIGFNDIDMPEKYESPSSDSVNDTIESHLCGGYVKAFGTSLYEPMKNMINRLIEEIRLLPENRERETWTICIHSGVRNYSPYSEHNYNGKHSTSHGGIAPNAVDLQITRVGKDGKASESYYKDYEKMFKVLDIICTNHMDEVGQVIFEGKTSGGWLNGFYKNDYNCLHVSYKGNKVSTSTPVVFLSDNNGGKNFARVRKEVPVYSSNVPPEYKAIAKKYYMKYREKPTVFRNIFTYYSLFNNDELAEHFNEIRTSSSERTGYINSDNTENRKRNNPGNLQWLGYPETIKRGSDQWDGVDYSGLSWSSRFAVFKDMIYGTRALFVNMNTQIVVKKKDTIRKLISEWAPEFENDTKNYIKSVVNRTGINPDTYRLTSIIENKDICINIAKQIAIKEEKINLTDDVINKAYEMAVSSIKRI